MTLANRQRELMNSLQPGAILKAQPDTDKTIKLISLLLMKIATLYQIPNWNETQSINLADWICINYEFDTLESVIKTLNNPPTTEKVWRLTPDTIREWMSIELDRLASKRERESHNQKILSPNNDIDLLLTEALKDSKPAKPILPLTEKDIQLEGQEKPYVKPYSSDHIDEVATLQEMKVKYGRECTDLLTGEIKPGSPSFDEWLLLNRKTS